LQSKYSITLATPPIYFALVITGDDVSRNICIGWPQTSILLISAIQVARITDMSHKHLAANLVSLMIFF
jgi:hypothetical protein